VEWKKSLGLFVVLICIAMVLPLVGATKVGIYYDDALLGDMIELDYSDIVEKSLNLNNPGNSASVELSITNGSADKQIIETHTYKCGARGPRVCANQVVPIKYNNDFTVDYAWSEVRDREIGYPQTANIITLVKVKRAGGFSWLGYWDVITRTGEGDFTVDSREIDEIEVHTSSTNFLYAMNYFIENFFTIPMNPNWVSKVVFKTATELRGLESNDPPSFWIGTVSGDEITSITDSYYFVFPKNDSGIMGSAVLNLNPDYTCGDDSCLSGTEENQANCCYDCGCDLVGYYCSYDMICSPESAITMTLKGSETRVTNCNEDHLRFISVNIENAPSDAIVKSATYSLAGDAYITTCARGVGGVFSCPITVPAVEDCDTGEYSVSPNSITMVIEFSDGKVKKTKSLGVSFPEITIGSFECGSGSCESELGENQDNCCLDCGCPDGDYCDWGGSGSVPSNAKCRNVLSDNDLVMGSINPSHFYDQQGVPNIADITVNINNKPASLETDILGCEMSCTSSGGLCESTCVVSGCVKNPENPDTHITECELSFFISDYDSLTDYELSPAFTSSVNYNNGTDDVISGDLESTFPIISIGAHWCGDYICGDDENYLVCCYDCGCPGG